MLFSFALQQIIAIFAANIDYAGDDLLHNGDIWKNTDWEDETYNNV